MSRFLLDTNILSNAIKPVPSARLRAWMEAQLDEDLYIASITIGEIRRGILQKPIGHKRRQLEDWFSGRDGPRMLFAGRVLPFDEMAALIWARLMAEGTAVGRPRSAVDMMIAAIAEANNCVIATDNEKHFVGVKLFNPSRD